MQKATTIIAAPAMSRTAARWSIATATMSLVLLAALHLIRAVLAPTWRMVSEYALGEYGWILSLMILIWVLNATILLIAVMCRLAGPTDPG